jgi:thiamine pyrophosphokinase
MEFFLNKGVKIERYPREKDSTDTEIALEKAISLGATEITFLGCVGGRLDHTLGNLGLLKRCLNLKIKAYLMDDKNIMFISGKSLEITGKSGEYFSVQAFGEKVTNLTIKNAKYRLSNYQLEFGDPITISNEFVGENVKIDGKNYSLATFGIGSVNYTEKGLLHINGDKDDSLVSALDDKLMKAINEDPDKVMTVLNSVADDLYSDLSDKMKSTKLRSALTLYNDKELNNQVTDYKDELSKLEVKLKDIEDRYYKQFSAMEAAMSKLNSQSSSLAGMLGK